MGFSVYLVPPDYLVVDQNSTHTSLKTRGKAVTAEVDLDEALFRTPEAFGIAERYHAPLRLIYEEY